MALRTRRRTNTGWPAAGLALLALLATPAASATQVLSLDPHTMTDKAAVVVWGKVSATRSERMAESPGRYHTLVSVSPMELLRTDAPAGSASSGAQEPVVFSVLGGKVGRYAQLVPGAPRFTVGEEVVLLLERQPMTQRLLIVGLSQGCYRVKRSGGSGVVDAVSDRTGTTLLARDPGGELRPAPPSARVERLPLDQLLARIRARLGARAGR